MKMFVALIAGALLSSGALAQHAGGASTGGSEPTTETREASAPAGEASAPAVGDRRVCRRIESTGSRLGTQRVCMTQREWRQYDRNN
jgi:hypothetical protein